MSQRQTIISHMKRYGSISPLEARHVHGIERLASRIDELRQEGFQIVTTMKRDAKGKRYASYEFAPEGVLLALSYQS
jgi:hypothetical protein